MKKKFPLRFVNPLPNLFFMVILFCLLTPGTLWSAEESTQEISKKTSTQQIGGLLFDVDEGVKVEQGPGGSVYMKSNKEFMQEKFLAIDQRFDDLESRIAELENKKNAQKTDSVKADENKKVWVS